MPKRILIVDDEPDVGASLARIIRLKGCKPVVANSVDEALVLQAAEPFSVIVTDFRMPSKTGDYLARAVKAEWPNTVVVVLSGYADTDNVLAILNHQLAFRFLLKPWDNAALLHELELAMHEHEQRRYVEIASQLFRDGDQPLFEFDKELNLLRTNSIARVMDRDFRLFDIFSDRNVIHDLLERQGDAAELTDSTLMFHGDKEAVVHLLLNGTERKLFSVDIKSKGSYKAINALSHDDFYNIIDYSLSTQRQFTVSLLSITNGQEIVKNFGADVFQGVSEACATKLSSLLVDNEYGGLYEDGLFFFVSMRDDEHQLVKRIEELVSRLSILVPNLQPEDAITIPLQVRAYYWLGEGGETSRSDVIAQLLATYNYYLGNNRNLAYRYNPRISGSRSREFAISSALYYAVDNNELELVYQSKWSHAQNAYDGAEILLRWCNPDIGVLEPRDFMAIAERDGQIIKIQEWVIEKAFQQTQNWRAHGFDPGMLSFNVSGKHLDDPGFMGFLETAILKYAIDASRFTIEISEVCLVERQQQAASVLASLKALGFKVSIDDFGTSYSTLAYLKSLTVDELKIDRSFVLESHQSGSAQLMLQKIVDIAHQLKLQVVAEGVENAEQNKLLLEMGCDFVQGFYVAKPLSSHDFQVERS